MITQAEPSLKRSQSFLVLDDEYIHAEHAHHLLSDFGWNVFPYECDPVVGQEQIIAHQPDVVLLDIRFSTRTEGLEILKSVREEAFRLHGTIPYAVFLTGLKDERILAEVTETRGAILLGKPIADDDLIAACKKAVDELPAWRAACQVRLQVGLWPDDVNRKRLALIQEKLELRLNAESEHYLTELQKTYEMWLEQAYPIEHSACEVFLRKFK
jgi:CheY-like chemotaxis protein